MQEISVWYPNSFGRDWGYNRGGYGLRLQLFKGSYAILLALAIVGLYVMLGRSGGDINTFFLWITLIVAANIGLVATQREVLAVGGTALGLVSTLYLRLPGARTVLSPMGGSHGPAWLDVTVGVYLLILITLVVIWVARRRLR